MKKIMLSVFIGIVLITSLPPTIFAAEHIPSRYYYAPWRNEYRVDHGGMAAHTFYAFRVRFTGNDSTVYEKDFSSYTGIFYLTCNGVYQLQWIDENENVLAETSSITTTQIINPPCDSYPEQQGVNDLNADYTDLGGGNYGLHWDDLPGATSYEIWKDGELVGTTTDPNYQIDSPGSVTIVAKDENGNPIGSSDLQVPTYDGDSWGENPPGNGCSTCDKLKDLLSCPGWSDYMGEWEDMLSRVIPPPPDWEHVANIFVNAFDDFFGDMPTAPTIQEIQQHIETPLPNLDISTGAEDLLPTLPQEFNNPINFDLSDAPVIEIIDDSQPFIISDPLDGYDTSPPGVGVIPGDPNNSSGDIIAPQTPEGLEHMPKPSGSGSSPIPPPSPGGIEYDHMDTPKPDITTGIIPIPGR